MADTAHDVSRLLSAASTNATVAKATPGRVHGWSVANTNAAARYLKLYDKATAPTVGTDTPKLTIQLPAAGRTEVVIPAGIKFTAGIGFALTTGVADSDTAAVAANEIIVNLLYS